MGYLYPFLIIRSGVNQFLPSVTGEWWGDLSDRSTLVVCQLPDDRAVTDVFYDCVWQRLATIVLTSSASTKLSRLNVYLNCGVLPGCVASRPVIG